MKKNNIIFIIIICLILGFATYKFIKKDTSLNRNVNDNKVESFKVKESVGRTDKDKVGYYDIYNNSEKTITEKFGGGELEVEYPPGYINRNYYFNGVLNDMEGEGALDFKPSKLEKIEGNEFTVTNGEYVVCKEIRDGKYKISVDFKSKEDVLELNINKGKTYDLKILKNKDSVEINLDKDNVINVNTYKIIEQKDSDGSTKNFEKRIQTMEKVKFTKIN